MSASDSEIFDRCVSAVGRRCSIDHRGLAAFRIGVGFLLLVDLITRSRNLVAFYTDAGVLPRRALALDYGTVYSIHTLSGEAWFQALLFLVAGGFALLLLLGYHTRIATVVSWLLLLSLQARNPMVLHSGDHLLGLLLFWGMFLPLGARWSIDAARVDRDREDGRSTVTSIASLALLMQVLVVYITNAIFKRRGEPWVTGDALAMVYQADHYTIFLGNVLASYPGVLEWLTAAWTALLLLSPLLLVLSGARRAVITTLFIGAHFGMALSINVSIFPFVSIVGLLVYYPPGVWESLARLADRTQFPERCRAARARWLAFTATLVPGPARSSSPSASTPDSNSSGVASGLAQARTLLDRTWGVIALVVPYLFLALMLTSSAASVGYASVPDTGEEVMDVTETSQSWSMFAPDPLHTTRWYAAPGELESGEYVDTLHQSDVIFDPGSDNISEVSGEHFERPERIEATYPSARYRKYLMNVQFADNERHRSYVANYLCDRWNRQHDTTVESVSLWGMAEQTHPSNGTVQFDREYQLIEYDCSGSFVQE